MTTTQRTPENSPEFLRRTGERSPEELDPRWDTLAEDAPAFAGEDPNNPATTMENAEIKYKQAAELASQGDNFEHEHDEPIYEKVYAVPDHADNIGNDEYNARMNEYLTKGFWRRIVGYENNDDGLQVNKIAEDYHPPVLESKLETEELKTFTPETYDQVVQKQDALEGLDSEGGELKAERLSETNISLDAAANIFELSHRADISASDIAEACKGMPEVRESIRELVDTTQEITTLPNESTNIAELKLKYDEALAAAERVRGDLAAADAPIQLTGAIMSKLLDLEVGLKESQLALESLNMPETSSSDSSGSQEDLEPSVTATPETSSDNQEKTETSEDAEEEKQRAEVQEKLAANKDNLAAAASDLGQLSES